MTPKLYMLPASPPVRAVLITAEALGVELEFEKVDLFTGQHKTLEYLQKNPQHTIPLLEDNGYYLADSHSINAYLVGKYAKDDSLYPTDLKKRGKVDERLYFDNGTLFNRLRECFRPIFFEGQASIPQQKIDQMNEAYEILEKFLEGNSWIAGEQLTIADFCIFATASATNVGITIDASKYPKLVQWLKKVESLPASAAANEGLIAFRELYKSKISQK